LGKTARQGEHDVRGKCRIVGDLAVSDAAFEVGAWHLGLLHVLFSGSCFGRRWVVSVAM
jgi:hypothetical protein